MIALTGQENRSEIIDRVGDVRLVFNGEEFDLRMYALDLERDSGIETAVLLSIFTDARVDGEDALPDDSDYRGGWWGNVLADVENDQDGSKAWLLSREKLTPETLTRFLQYAADSLAWMKTDNAAQKIDVTGEISEGVLYFTVKITGTTTGPEFLRYALNWENQILRRV